MPGRNIYHLADGLKSMYLLDFTLSFKEDCTTGQVLNLERILYGLEKERWVSWISLLDPQ